jgi:hypothetical protein
MRHKDSATIKAKYQIQLKPEENEEKNDPDYNKGNAGTCQNSLPVKERCR